MTYTQHRDTQDTLAVLDRLDLDTEKLTEEDIAKKFGWDDDSKYVNGVLPWYRRLQPKLWQLFDEPYSSNAAKVTTDDLSLLKFEQWRDQSGRFG